MTKTLPGDRVRNEVYYATDSVLNDNIQLKQTICNEMMHLKIFNYS